MTSDSRFKVVAAPVLSPGVCFVCKSETNGPFVDTGASDQWIGTYYICTACLKEMAAVLEISQSPVFRLQDQAWKVGYSTGVKDVHRAVSGILTTIGPDLIPRSPYDASVEVPDGDEEISPSLFDFLGSNDDGAEQSDSPVSVEGVDGLSGDSGDGDRPGEQLPDFIVSG